MTSPPVVRFAATLDRRLDESVNGAWDSRAWVLKPTEHRSAGRYSINDAISVVGAGYVGYPLALLLAEAGHNVVAVDTDQRIVDAINRGQPLLDEPGIAKAVADISGSGRLSASKSAGPSEAYILAVPTPLDELGRRVDLTAVEAAARSIVPHLKRGNLVVIESTVPPGTSTTVILPILEASGLDIGDDVLLAHCPERVRPGATMNELVHVDRIVGGINERSTAAAVNLYSSFVESGFEETDIVTAELCKLMENTYRDVNIALSNQVAEIATKHGVDPLEAVRIANGHPRVDYLAPGIGVGGHCIPVDPWFLVSEVGENGGVVGAARAVNDRQPLLIAQMIADQAGNAVRPRVVLVGAAYKPEVSDTRNAPAFAIREDLLARGFDVVTYDPLVDGYGGDLAVLASEADLVAILVPHRRVVGNLRAEADLVTAAMRRPLILDFSSGTPQAL